MSAEPVSFELPAELVEAIAKRVVEILGESMAPAMEPMTPSPYLSGWRAAAEYVGVSESTLKHTPSVPRHKVGGAVIFRRDELDLWVDGYFEGQRRYRRAQAGSIMVPYEPSARSRRSVGANKNPA